MAYCQTTDTLQISPNQGMATSGLVQTTDVNPGLVPLGDSSLGTFANL